MNGSSVLFTDRDTVSPQGTGIQDESAWSERRRGPLASGTSIRWLAEATNHIASLAQLGENWDGYDAAAPDPAILASAVEFLKEVVGSAGVEELGHSRP